MTRSVLGVYFGHDPAACLLQDGRITVFIEDERLTRYKYGRPKSIGKQWPGFAGRQGYFPWAAVTYCLRTGGLSLDELDAIVVPAEWSGEGVLDYLPVRDRSRILLATEPVGAVHHFRHALSTYFASPYERAAVLVADDDGSVLGGAYEAESGYLFEGRRGVYDLLFKNRYPRAQTVRHGLGWMYHAVSDLLGFADPRLDVSEAGKTMGLAPYGGPCESLKEPWIAVEGTKLDFSGFEQWLRRSGHLERAQGGRDVMPLFDEDGRPNRAACDIAFKAQRELEDALVALARVLRKKTNARSLCLAGGVALNSVANQRILDRAHFEELFVQPASGDSGQAIGLAFWGHLALETCGFAAPPGSRAPREPEPPAIPIHPIPHAYGGREWPEDGIEALLEASGLRYRRHASPEHAADAAAAALLEGHIVGWFQGRSEYGPRSLGHRSILADPRGETTKDVVNARVKFREAFRPFAPSVLARHAGEVFDMTGESPYMLRVVPVREGWRARVPAITHVDHSARVQTVTAESSPSFHRLIHTFFERTGVPLVLNTSFNLRGMPIVESPWDALNCFVSSDMDGLFLGRFQVEPPAPSDLVFRRAVGWHLTAERPLEGGADVRVWARSRGGSSWHRDVRPALAEILANVDGQRSVAALLGSVPPEVTAHVVAELRLFLRQRALSLHLGALELPVAFPGETLSSEQARILCDRAGMISARLADL
ncbi:carbamoyltransferase [Pendulispora albinea]|uniref:Carbamoyltransferase n=1 Tax=Pendulispora albinea TaxID=2741071 RepID=A0ABZ2LN40_9BACT